MSDLLRTPLYDLHVELGAKMVPFAGYDMPVQYPLGVMKEHLHCRAAAGLFDVSHMGQVILRGADAAAQLESLIPQNVLGLSEGRQRYGFFTNEQGGILDDLMFANRGDHLLLVVNAANKAADIAVVAGTVPSMQWLGLIGAALRGFNTGGLVAVSVADLFELYDATFEHAPNTVSLAFNPGYPTGYRSAVRGASAQREAVQFCRLRHADAVGVYAVARR